MESDGPTFVAIGVLRVVFVHFSFERVTYMIGRSPTMVDYVLDSRDNMRSMYISRCHARVVRQAGNKHRLFDDSLNGIFVNNIKIAGKVKSLVLGAQKIKEPSHQKVLLSIHNIFFS